MSQLPLERPILSAHSISHHFKNGGEILPVLENVSLSVFPQEFVCILGPSGCGKSTLLRILAGLLQSSQGEVVFENQPLTGPRRRIGMVFQNANLMPWRTVLQNITLPLETAGVSPQQASQKAAALAALVGLTGFEHTLPRDLSGGMAMRVAIARALVHEPDLLLLDEPFGSLDALTRERMGVELLRIWQAHQKTVIMVTHSISEALFLADRVLVLSPQPGSLRLDLAVNLPRPRTLDLRYTPAFGALARQVRAAIGG